MWSRLSPSALAPGSHTLLTGPHPKTEVQYAPVLGALLAPESYEVARAFFPWIYRASTSRRRSAGFPDYRYWPLIESCPYRRRDLRTPPHRAHPLPGWCRRWLRRFPAPGCWIRAAAVFFPRLLAPHAPQLAKPCLHAAGRLEPSMPLLWSVGQRIGWRSTGGDWAIVRCKGDIYV
jgi:hypothetical protein